MEFLTGEWVAALDAAARGSGALRVAAGDPLVVELVVRDPDGIERRHHLRVGADSAAAGVGGAADVDVVVIVDRETAAALAAGTLNGQRALIEGRLKLRGDVNRLAAHREALVALGDVFAAVRAATEPT